MKQYKNEQLKKCVPPTGRYCPGIHCWDYGLFDVMAEEILTILREDEEVVTRTFEGDRQRHQLSLRPTRSQIVDQADSNETEGCAV